MKTESHAAARLRNAFFARKWLVILVIAAVLIFFGRVVDNKSLTQSAIVIGLGIDRSDEGAFVVSTQSVVLNGGTGDGSATQSFAVYTDEGKTISEALDKISQKMGLLISLSHCNVLIVSPAALLTEHALLFAPLIGAYQLPEQAVVVSASVSPSDVLAARTGTTVASSYFIQTSLIQNLGGDGLAMVTVKDFMAHTLSRSGSVNIPYVEPVEAQFPPQTAEAEGEKFVQLIMNKNLVVTDGGNFVIDERLAQAATLVVQKDVLGKLSPVLPDGEAVEFRVLNVKSETKADGTDARTEVEIKVSFMEIQNTAASDKVTPSDDIVKNAAKELEDELAAAIRECYDLSVETGADILHLQDKVYQSVGRDLPEDCLADISFSCRVTVTVSENG